MLYEVILSAGKRVQMGTAGLPKPIARGQTFVYEGVLYVILEVKPGHDEIEAVVRCQRLGCASSSFPE
jgi:hypothetical protein